MVDPLIRQDTVVVVVVVEMITGVDLGHGQDLDPGVESVIIAADHVLELGLDPEM